MSINDGGPAFPARVSVNRDTNELQPHQFGNDDFCTTGLSLRDYFAAKALTNLYTQCEENPDKAAEWAYQLADAMLKAREIEP